MTEDFEYRGMTGRLLRDERHSWRYHVLLTESGRMVGLFANYPDDGPPSPAVINEAERIFRKMVDEHLADAA